MRGYKGFEKTSDGRLMCRGFAYEPGKTYKHDGEIELCRSGFHACHELYQVWFFYPNNGENVFYEVECGGKMIESKDGSGKFVCSEITLIQPVGMDNVALFDSAEEFSEGLAIVKFDRRYNFISTEGKTLSERWFDYTEEFSEGFARVELGGKYNFINTKGKTLSEQWFDYAGYFSEGFARIWLDGKCNFINTEGKLLSEQWFGYAGYFSEGFALVKLDWKYNFIDMNGKLLSNTWFKHVQFSTEGHKEVLVNDKYMRINDKGELSDI